MKKSEIIKCAQACVNTYGGKYGKVKKVFDLTVEFDIKDVQGHTGIKGDTLYIVYQGSKGSQDWKDNFKFWQKDARKIAPYGNEESKIRVHAGHIRQYKQVRKYIHGIIKAATPARIVVTGHSLGGSLAALCAVDIEYNFKIAPECVTFGSPRTGNKEFAESFNRRIKNSLRYVNGSDIVCTVPIWGYKHFDELKKIGRRNVLRIFKDHYPDDYLRKI